MAMASKKGNVQVLLSHSADLCASIATLASGTRAVDLAPCSGFAVPWRPVVAVVRRWGYPKNGGFMVEKKTI